ncbi:MAG: HAMP domain-containing protein [Anaerolineaceae bacterium]|nr:HAMP domain-containing protein [Anaerolineaceae bacterium]
MSQPSTTSIKSIKRRLIMILVRAFLVVGVVGMVALIGFTIFEISRNTEKNPFYRDPNATILEAYYLGRGSWDGIEALVDPGLYPDSKLIRMDWENFILIDQYGRVVMYYGQFSSNLPSDVVKMPVEIEQTTLTARGKIIGTLISEKRQVSRPVRLTLGTMNPVFMVAVLLVLLTVVIGVLLMRRVVNPLSEVIAASESVASGNLSTRIKLKKSKDDLYDLGVHFNKMTEALERNNNERRAMLADIAHELRTPLSVIRGKLEGMMDGIYPSNETNIAQALEETYLLERLVEDLRLLTLAETRQLHFEMKETDLVDLARRTIGVFEPQADSKKVSISLDTDEMDLIINIDPQRIEQVIGNLIGNALRFVPENGFIQLSLARKGENAEITVSDNGPGVKDEDLPFIFDRFFRSEKSRARASGGAGLGLAICKQLVEAQGGKISAANKPEGGLSVKVTLPISRK